MFVIWKVVYKDMSVILCILVLRNARYFVDLRERNKNVRIFRLLLVRTPEHVQRQKKKATCPTKSDTRERPVLNGPH
jgi:hypothetical protein